MECDMGLKYISDPHSLPDKPRIVLAAALTALITKKRLKQSRSETNFHIYNPSIDTTCQVRYCYIVVQRENIGCSVFAPAVSYIVSCLPVDALRQNLRSISKRPTRTWYHRVLM